MRVHHMGLCQHASDLSARMARVQQRAAISLSSATPGQGRTRTACMDGHAAAKLPTTFCARAPSAQHHLLLYAAPSKILFESSA